MCNSDKTYTIDVKDKEEAKTKINHSTDDEYLPFEATIIYKGKPTQNTIKQPSSTMARPVSGTATPQGIEPSRLPSFTNPKGSCALNTIMKWLSTLG